MATQSVSLPAVLDTPEGRDLVRDMLAFAAEQLMEAEVEARCGVPNGPPGPHRIWNQIPGQRA